MFFFALLMIANFAALTAITSRRAIATLPPAASPFDAPFYRGMYSIIAVHVPVLGYFYHAYTSWSVGYLIDPLRLPIMFGFVLAGFAFTAYFFFYLGTQALLRARRPLTAFIATTQTGLAVLIYGVLFTSELTHVGSYYEFHAGTARRLAPDNGLYEISFGFILFTVSGLIVLVRNALDDRRYPPLELEDSKW